MTRAGPALALAITLSTVTIAAGQTSEPPGAVSQITPATRPADDVRSGQIGHATREIATPYARAAVTALPSPQITARGDTAPPGQIVRESRTARGAGQLSHGPPSAKAAAPLSTPADGRTPTIARVNGRDRCDPAFAPPGDGCGAVIETRGAEFPPPSAEPLSPEQRLLVEQRIVEQRDGGGADSIARAAARGAVRDGTDASAPDIQGVASVFLGTTVPPPVKIEDPAAGLTADQAAIATGVLGALDGTAP